MSIELQKLKRLHSIPITLAAVLAAILVGGMATRSRTYLTNVRDNGEQMWQQGILQLVLVIAIVTPLLVAVLASRQVDIEHASNGWLMNRSAGLSMLRMLAGKALVVGCTVSVAIVGEVVGVCFLHWLAGNRAPIPWAGLLAMTVGATLTSAGLTVMHLWFAARFENQLAGLGVGVLGSFIGAFSLLLPPQVCLLLPWGYYALSSPVMMTDNRSLHSVQPPWIAFGVFCALCFSVAAFLSVRLDRDEL